MDFPATIDAIRRDIAALRDEIADLGRGIEAWDDEPDRQAEIRGQIAALRRQVDRLQDRLVWLHRDQWRRTHYAVPVGFSQKRQRTR